MNEDPTKRKPVGAIAQEADSQGIGRLFGLGNQLIHRGPPSSATKLIVDALLSGKSRQKIEPINITTPANLGSLIRSSRATKKLTQQQLADLAGVGRRFIVECESGKPRLEFAKVLQVTAAAGIDIFAIKR
jgi:y4mF family transcriptional regulator